jgi:hypothetical protein
MNVQEESFGITVLPSVELRQNVYVPDFPMYMKPLKETANGPPDVGRLTRTSGILWGCAYG